jgi:hypothetical protein
MKRSLAIFPILLIFAACATAPVRQPEPAVYYQALTVEPSWCVYEVDDRVFVYSEDGPEWHPVGWYVIPKADQTSQPPSGGPRTPLAARVVRILREGERTCGFEVLRAEEPTEGRKLVLSPAAIVRTRCPPTCPAPTPTPTPVQVPAPTPVPTPQPPNPQPQPTGTGAIYALKVTGTSVTVSTSTPGISGLDCSAWTMVGTTTGGTLLAPNGLIEIHCHAKMP